MTPPTLSNAFNRSPGPPGLRRFGRLKFVNCLGSARFCGYPPNQLLFASMQRTSICGRFALAREQPALSNAFDTPADHCRHQHNIALRFTAGSPSVVVDGCFAGDNPSLHCGQSGGLERSSDQAWISRTLPCFHHYQDSGPRSAGVVSNAFDTPSSRPLALLFSGSHDLPTAPDRSGNPHGPFGLECYSEVDAARWDNFPDPAALPERFDRTAAGGRPPQRPERRRQCISSAFEPEATVVMPRSSSVALNTTGFDSDGRTPFRTVRAHAANSTGRSARAVSDRGHPSLSNAFDMRREPPGLTGPGISTRQSFGQSAGLSAFNRRPDRRLPDLVLRRRSHPSQKTFTRESFWGEACLKRESATRNLGNGADRAPLQEGSDMPPQK